MVVPDQHKWFPPLGIPTVTLVGDYTITVACPASHRAVLPMLAKANNEDEDKTYGKQGDGGLNLRKVPKIVAIPDVETMLSRLDQTRGSALMKAPQGGHLSLLLRTQKPVKCTDVEEMIADGR
jgi:hypothetical protein